MRWRTFATVASTRRCPWASTSRDSSVTAADATRAARATRRYAATRRRPGSCATSASTSTVTTTGTVMPRYRWYSWYCESTDRAGGEDKPPTQRPHNAFTFVGSYYHVYAKLASCPAPTGQVRSGQPTNSFEVLLLGTPLRQTLWWQDSTVVLHFVSRIGFLVGSFLQPIPVFFWLTYPRTIYVIAFSRRSTTLIICHSPILSLLA